MCGLNRHTACCPCARPRWGWPLSRAQQACYTGAAVDILPDRCMHACAQAARGPPSFSRSSATSAASPSGRSHAGPGERPVKVHAHGKLVKELTGLATVQELNAHNGAQPLACVSGVGSSSGLLKARGGSRQLDSCRSSLKDL